MKDVKIRVNFQCLKDSLLSYRQNLQGLGLQKMSWKEDYYLKQSLISRKYIKFIVQVILAVCIQCVIIFFWHQERTFLFYTLSLYVSLSLSDDLSQLIFRNDKWCICFKQHGKWQIRVFSYARFRIIANHSLDNALVVYVNDSSRKGITMVILQKFSSAVLRSLRVLSAILGVVIGNIALNALSSQHPIWIWLPFGTYSHFLGRWLLNDYQGAILKMWLKN